MQQFDWDESNTEHIARHGLTPEEVEYAFNWGDPELIDFQQRKNELRRMIVAKTRDGRHQVFIYVIREKGVRPITTFPANPKRIELYEQRRKEE